jgi:hypothetical protein
MICILDSLLSAHHHTYASLNTLTDGLIDLIGLDLDLERPSNDRHTTHQAHRTYAPPPHLPPTPITPDGSSPLLVSIGNYLYEKVPPILFLLLACIALATSFLASGVPQALRRRLASIWDILLSMVSFVSLLLLPLLPFLSLFPFSFFLFSFWFAQRPQKIPPGGLREKENTLIISPTRLWNDGLPTTYLPFFYMYIHTGFNVLVLI